MRQDARRYVIRPEDAQQGHRIAKMAMDGVRQAARESTQGEELYSVEVIVQRWEPPRTDAQRKTLWMWHGEVASELTLRTGKPWDKDAVHEIIFIPRFMPEAGEFVDPQTGEVLTRRKRTGEATKGEISDAMAQYLAWIYEMGISVTVPDDGKW